MERETLIIKNADYPEYANQADRLRSFSNWPSDRMNQTAEQLSDAGFFYTQNSDHVRCFCCGGGLRDWEKTDDPWEEHASWYSKCEYLELVKGKGFSDIIKAKRLTSINQKRNEQSYDIIEYPIKLNKENKIATSEISKKEEDEDTSETDNVNERCACDSRLCKICYSAQYNVAFLPCGHIFSCIKCASLFSKCPMCQKSYDSLMRVYFN